MAIMYVCRQGKLIFKQLHTYVHTRDRAAVIYAGDFSSVFAAEVQANVGGVEQMMSVLLAPQHPPAK